MSPFKSNRYRLSTILCAGSVIFGALLIWSLSLLASSRGYSLRLPSSSRSPATVLSKELNPSPSPSPSPPPLEGSSSEVEDSTASPTSSAEPAPSQPEPSDAESNGPSAAAEPELTAAGATGSTYPHLSSTDLELSSRVALIIKTGLTVASSRLPPQVLTTLQHVKHYLLFSDYAHDLLPGVHVHDSFAELNRTALRGIADFDLYFLQQKLGATHPEISKLDGGWKLDKYKNLPIGAQALKLLPAEVDWFMFIDADTYVFWHNLLQLVPHLPDPRKKHSYIGSPAAGFRSFAHGGSGYLVSRYTMERVFVDHPEVVADEWLHKTEQYCCGDKMFAVAVKTLANGKLTNGRPSIQGENLETVYIEKPFGCRPLLTLHHLSASGMFSAWDFERKMAKPGKAIIYRDLWDEVYIPRMVKRRVGWDNRSGEKKSVPGDERECQQLCEREKTCMQWMWKGPKECWISKKVRAGYEAAKRDKKEWVSGWMLDRVEKLRRGWDECGEKDGYTLISGDEEFPQ